MASEVLTGNNPAGDARILSAIVAAEDVVDPARAAPMGMEAILEAFKPLAPKPKPVAKAVTDEEFAALKVAYADGYLEFQDAAEADETTAHRKWMKAESALWIAHKSRKAGGR